jgi:hypothetical protein
MDCNVNGIYYYQCIILFCSDVHVIDMCDSCFHQDLKHTNIVQLFYYHELPTEIYLIIEVTL